MLQYGSRMLVEFIAQLTSVERVLDYTRIETEDNLHQGSKFGMEIWFNINNEGATTFRSIC